MVDEFLRKAKDAILGSNNDEQQQPDADSRQPHVRPASEDPYGDPADQ